MIVGNTKWIRIQMKRENIAKSNREKEKASHPSIVLEKKSVL